MPLTPIDIQQKTFGPELRGYNMDEVDDFLDEVVTALKDYDQRVRDAQDRIRALETELSTRGEDESAISRALVAAQKQADAIVAESQAEARRIQSEAQGAADQLRAEREAERVGLTQDIARMRSTVADLKRRVIELATSVSAGLDEMDSAASIASQGVDDKTDDLTAETPAIGAYDQASVGEGLAPFGELADSDAEVADDVDEDSSEMAHEVDDDEIEEWEDALSDDDVDVHDHDGDGDGDGGDDPEDPVSDSADVFVDDDTGEEEDEPGASRPPSHHGQHLSSDADVIELDSDDEAGPTAARRPWERGSI
ncbi:hypothetical protein BH23ACT5_BH23ACT5_17680 [soil metagenome]